MARDTPPGLDRLAASSRIAQNIHESLIPDRRVLRVQKPSKSRLIQV